MSKVKNGGLDQYGAEPFEQQQFGTAGFEGVKTQLVQSSLPMSSRANSASPSVPVIHVLCVTVATKEEFEESEPRTPHWQPQVFFRAEM